MIRSGKRKMSFGYVHRDDHRMAFGAGPLLKAYKVKHNNGPVTVPLHHRAGPDGGTAYCEFEAANGRYNKITCRSSFSSFGTNIRPCYGVHVL